MTIDYLITGGAGFIGSNIARHLLRGQHSVRVFDNFLTGKRENILDGMELVEGDLRDLSAVRRAVTGVRYVLHLAALPSVPRSVAEPLLAHDINLTGILNVLLAARDARCQRVVFSSSSAVYGDTPVLPKREEMTPSPLSPYGLHKLAGEYYCRLFWQLYGLPTVSLRYFNVFGPRQYPKSEYAAVIPKFIAAILNDRPPVIFGDGHQTRDFTYVENVVAANLAACEAGEDVLGESLNIACGERISLLDLVNVINRVTGKNVAPRFGTSRAGDIVHSQADISRAGKLLGWKPRVDFISGMEQTVAWYRTSSHPLGCVVQKMADLCM